MKTTSFLRAALGGIFLILSVCSCQKKEAGASAESASGSITLNVLNYKNLSDANAAAEIEYIWDNFASQNPDIQINREDLYNESYHDKIGAYVALGRLPDVMYVWPSGRSTSLHQYKLLKNLMPLIQKDGLQNSYFPMALDPVNQGGGYVGMIPISITSTHGFYINLEVLKDCGLSPAQSYGDLKAQVPLLKAKGYETVIMPNKSTWVMQSCLFSLVAGRFCGLGWEEKILSGKAKFTDSDFVNALAFIRQLYTDGVLSEASLGIAFEDSPKMFATNKGAYMIDGDWRVGAFITDKSTGQALISPERQKNILITVFPDIEGTKLNKSTSGILGTGYGMNAAIPAGSPKEAAAWRLIKWLTGKETETHRIETGRIATPVWVDLDYSAMHLEPMQITIGNLGNEYTTVTAVIDGVFHSDISNSLNDGLAEIGMRTKTPEQVAQEIQQVFDTWKKKQ